MNIRYHSVSKYIHVICRNILWITNIKYVFDEKEKDCWNYFLK